LGWEYNVLERMHLDNFEEMRSTQRSKNFKKEKKLSKFERERLLRSFGVTKKDMQAAAKEATMIRKKRQQSIRVALNPTTLNNDKLHEKVEGGIRKVKKTITKVSRSLRRKESTVDESGNIRRASILVAMIALMDDDECASHRSSLLRRNISNISSSGELEGSSTKGILKHSSSYVSFGEVEGSMHEVLPTIESKEDTTESNIEDKEEVRRRGKRDRDKDRRSITNQADDIEEVVKEDEHMNDEGATAAITEEGDEEVVGESGTTSIAKQDGKVDTAEVDMDKAETVTANQDSEEVEEVSTTLEEAVDIKDEENINNDNTSKDEDVVKQEIDTGEGKVVSEDDGDAAVKDDTAEENSNRRTSSSSFATKSTAGDEEEETDEGKTDDEGNTSFSLRDLGCDHAKYLSIKNDIRSASSSVLMKL